MRVEGLGFRVQGSGLKMFRDIYTHMCRCKAKGSPGVVFVRKEVGQSVDRMPGGVGLVAGGQVRS